MGRPSDYSPEICAEICARLADGRSLRSICRDDDMPHTATVFVWLEKHPVGYFIAVGAWTLSPLAASCWKPASANAPERAAMLFWAPRADVVWCDAPEARESGQPYPSGIRGHGINAGGGTVGISIRAEAGRGQSAPPRFVL